ncbi:hypothetical protein EZS27_026577 [termite gut metagenome]|uniref:Uncharacterized protein n=1 Tax=termite gut metagenome TaxID=433724 RepID=A0A5J4QT84_9ZZZZ
MHHDLLRRYYFQLNYDTTKITKSNYIYLVSIFFFRRTQVDTLIRVSVEIEDIKDLIADLEQALFI